MQINPNISADSAGSLLRPRSDAGAATPTQSENSSEIDPSLQRLTEPAELESDGDIRDEAGTNQAISFLSQSILNQSGSAMKAQANPLSQNVLSLLQPMD
ncbi:MAG TPA: hypothetical protein VGN61_02615 [Verrucomicrobiae bacterium]|jgi:hypothetical protein